MTATAIGALGVSTSGIFVDLSNTSPGTASFFRCALALPVLAPFAYAEYRRLGRLDRGQLAWAMVAGVLFAADALLWTQAIYEVGAGLSAVLVNAQVFIVPLLAAVIDHERLGRTFQVLLPVIVVGILLTGGIFESGVTGTSPTAGTIHAILAALCYSCFLFVLRRGGSDQPLVQSYTVVMVTAALASAAGGALWHGVTLAPGWRALGWLALTAMCGQVLGWLLVALTTARLPVEVGAGLLMITPVAALVLAAVFLDQEPSLLQIAGCTLVLAAAYAIATVKRRSRPSRLERGSPDVARFMS